MNRGQLLSGKAVLGWRTIADGIQAPSLAHTQITQIKTQSSSEEFIISIHPFLSHFTFYDYCDFCSSNKHEHLNIFDRRHFVARYE